jgi:hypothetical protein
LGLINGIFATSLGTVVMSNNTIGAISTNAATAAMVIPLMGFILLVLEREFYSFK